MSDLRSQTSEIDIAVIIAIGLIFILPPVLFVALLAILQNYLP